MTLQKAMRIRAELKKKLNKELEEVRDELSAFNTSRKIDYELPEGIL